MGKNRLFLYAGFVVILVFGIVIFLSLNEHAPKAHIKVSSLPQAAPPMEESDEENKKSFKLTESKPSSLPDSASSQISESTLANSTSTPQEGFIVRIQDAMEQPAASGIISIGTKEYQFTKGQLVINDLQVGDIPVSVSAEGYSPVNKVINLDKTSSAVITMEYLNSYEISVENINGSTSTENFTVRIWKGDSPSRPTKNNTAVVTTKYGYDLSRTGFGFLQNQCIVTQGLIYPPKVDFDTKTDGASTKGDRLLALGNCAWFFNSSSNHQISNFSWMAKEIVPIQKAQSPNLRIWDALYLAQQKEPNSINQCKEKCEVQRGSKTGYYFITFPELPQNSQLLCELQTDKNGKCRIDNLPPALYYAQAFKDNQSSMIVPMHPACGGANLRVDDHSHVSVFVRKEGIEYKAFKQAAVEHAEVILRAAEGQSGFYSAVTTHGKIDFSNVPYGKYHLAITPLDGQRIEKEILIQKPEERIDVSISGWEKYTISGILIDADTEKPIPEYPLILDDNSTNELTMTGEDGRFVFPDIPARMYNISIDLATFNNYQYLPEIHDFAMSHQRLYSVAKAAVPGASYENIEIRLYKPQETKFSGRVLAKDKNPMAGVNIYVSFAESSSAALMKLHSFPVNAVSDQNGYFSVTIIGGQKNYYTQGTFEITAIDGVQNIPAFEPNNRWSGTELETMNVGSLSIEGKAGQTYEKLEIIMQGKKDKTFYGHLNVDEDDFKGIQIFAIQSTFWINGKLKNNDFTISNLAPGEFILQINPPWETEVETQYETKFIKKYLSVIKNITMPDNQKEMHVDITFRKNAYMMGWATADNGKPLRGVDVIVIYENPENSLKNRYMTDNKGFFFIDGLSSNEYYRLRFSRGEEDKEIYRSEPLMPETKEIKIEVKE